MYFARDNFDQYGGNKSYRSKASGFFRLDKINDRNYLITPEGNAYLSLGINHYMKEFITADYNRTFWEKTFQAKFGTPEWDEKFKEKLHNDMSYVGLNTVGTHNEDDVKQGFGHPYVCVLPFVHNDFWLDAKEIELPDIFSPEFIQQCDKIAKKALDYKDDPFLLGYQFSDGPMLTETDAAPRPWSVYCMKHPGVIPWPRRLRNLNKFAEGKREYTKLITRIYNNDIDSFNHIYNTSFSNFTDLLEAENWRIGYDLNNNREKEDNTEFLKVILEQYFKTITAALRKYDGNHLILGDKMNWNTDFSEFEIEVSAKYCDLTFYQFYGTPDEHLEYCETAHSITGKPVYCGDSGYVSPEYPNMPYPFGIACNSPEARGHMAYTAMHTLFARPYFVGWDWCGIVDSWITNERPGQHSGIQNPFGEFHMPITNALRSISLHIHDIARLSAENMKNLGTVMNHS